MKIHTRLLVCFLIFSIIPISVLSVFFYYKFKKTLLEEETVTLVHIAQSKNLNIEKFFKEKEEDTVLLSRTPIVIEAMEKLSSPQHKDLKSLDEELTSFLSYYRESVGLHDIFLISLDGDIVFSLEKEVDYGTNLNTGIYKNTSLRKAFRQTKILLDPIISKLDYYQPSGKPASFIANPILKNNKIIGVVALQFLPSEIYRQLQDYTELHEFGEIIITTEIGSKVVFVAPTRSDPNAAFQQSVEFGSEKGLPVQESVRGAVGHGIATNYKGVKVLAAWGYSPHFQGGVVAEIPIEELLAPGYRLRNWALAIGGLVLLITLFIIFRVAKSISDPIKRLHEGTEAIESGNLDYKIGTDSKDEIGQLSRAFDAMTHNLKESTTSIDNLNKEVIERKKAENIKSMFVSTISHELRSPLTSVIEGVNLLLDKKFSESIPEGKELLELIQNNSQRLLALINDILDFQKLESEHSLSMEENDINKVVQEVAGALDLKLKKKGLSLVLELDENLPQTLFNHDKIVQVLANLVDNAIKFTDQGSITVKSKKEENVIHVIVQDTGPGIKKEDIPKLFKSFTQLDTQESPKKPGSGLGLAICKSIIDSHQGSIWVESEPGKGASFHITLLIQKKPST